MFIPNKRGTNLETKLLVVRHLSKAKPFQDQRFSNMFGLPFNEPYLFHDLQGEQL